MENHLDRIILGVKELAGAELLEDCVVLVVPEVVGDDGGLFPGAPGVHAALEADDGLLGHQVAAFGQAPAADVVQQGLAHFVGDLVADVFKFIEHGLGLEHIDVDRLVGRLGDDERHDGDGDVAGAQPVVESRQGFDEQVVALVGVFVAAAGKQVNGAVEVEAVAGKKVPGDKLVISETVVNTSAQWAAPRSMQ